MNIPLDQYKKVADGEKSAVLQHPLGHKITIAKNVLSPALKKQIAELRLHLADGGDGNPEEEDEGISKAPESAPEEPQASFDPTIQAPPPSDQLASVDPSLAEPMPAQMPPPPAQVIPQQVPSQGPQSQDLHQQGMQEQEQAIKGGAEAQGQAGAKQADVLQQSIDQQKKLLSDFQNQYKEHDNEIEKVGNEIRSNLIDPHKYWNDKSTGGKISTAIGLILGGMGGGLMHQENPALKFLMSNIQNDIESQKSNLGARENLLTAANSRMHNMFGATNMAMATGLQIAKNEVEKVAAQSQNPIVQARAQQLLGQLHQQQGIYKYNMTMQGMLNGGQLPASAQGYLPAGLKETVVKLPNGTLAQANSKEDAEKFRQSEGAYQNISDMLSQAKDFVDKQGYAIPFTKESEEANSIKQGIAMAMRQSQNITRFSPEQIKYFEEGLSHIGGFRSDLAKQQINDLIGRLDSQRNANANSLLSGPNRAPTRAVTTAPNMSPPNLKQKNMSNLVGER